MVIFLCILLGVLLYVVGAGATHGYAKHRWPSEHTSYGEMDDNERRLVASILWPFYWTFIWTFTTVNEVVFSKMEKRERDDH